MAIFEEICRRHPEIGAGVRRTLERRIRAWRALNGPERDVIFRQEHPPGRMGLSDFTDMGDLGVTIAGEPSRSPALSLPAGLLGLRACPCRARRRELRGAGRRPAERAVGAGRRAASNTAATASRRRSAISIAIAQEDLTRRYEELCAHYGMTPTRNNRGVAHENGSIESSAWPSQEGASRTRCCCAARATSTILAAYRRFVDEIVGRRNARNRKRIEIERTALKHCRTDGPPITRRRASLVTSSGGFILRKVFYTVPSRLIGHRLHVRLYDDRLECFLGATQLLTLRRGRPPQGSGKHGHVVDYRHVIHALRRKPMALLNLVYRDQLFPRRAYARAFEALLANESEKQACRTMVGLLALAHERACEAELAQAIDADLDAGGLPDLDRLRDRFAPDRAAIPDVAVELVPLSAYDELAAVRAPNIDLMLDGGVA